MSGIGSMRHRITLMREEKAQGAGGRMMITTPVIADVWASVEADDGSLSEEAGRQLQAASARFMIHYRDDFRTIQRISWQGRLWRVQSQATTSTDKRFVQLRASEIR